MSARPFEIPDRELPLDGDAKEARGFRFSPPEILFHDAFADPVIDAEGITRSGLFAAIQQRLEFVVVDNARLANIADDPSVIFCAVGHCRFGRTALVAWREDNRFTIHRFGLSSVSAPPMMAEGAAPSSAAPPQPAQIATEGRS